MIKVEIALVLFIISSILHNAGLLMRMLISKGYIRMKSIHVLGHIVDVDYGETVAGGLAAGRRPVAEIEYRVGDVLYRSRIHLSPITSDKYYTGRLVHVKYRPERPDQASFWHDPMVVTERFLSLGVNLMIVSIAIVCFSMLTIS